MADLAISNVLNISVSQAPAGIGAYNTSNLALLSTETPGGTFTGTYKMYVDPDGVATDFGSSSITYLMALAVFSQSPNILANGGCLIVIPLLSAGAETSAAAIARANGLVQYFGIMSTRVETQAPMLAAAAVVQATNKMAFFAQKTATTVDVGGALDLLRSGSFFRSRGLLYGATLDNDALIMQAAYAGRALSTIFSGSNTTQTMNLKDLSGIQPDPSLTQTIFDKAKAAGADVYASIQGVPKTQSFGANRFFDQVYNQSWFSGALQVAGFNYLATTPTKIPQTEDGMIGWKGAYGTVCEQAKSNQYIAPGKWTSATTFGNPADFLANIAQFGYYIYSAPINDQLMADRLLRAAPLVQIAIKEAGAMHTGNVVININP